VALVFSDEFEHGFAWSSDEDKLPRTSHAIRSGDRVWLTDTVDGPGLDERVRELGEPVGVVQLIDRHKRDCAAVAARLDVPLHVVEAPPELESRTILSRRFWKEIVLWLPAERVLVCGDALGSLGYFRAKNELFGVHPILRFVPPRRALAGLEPEHILFGHGPGAHGPETPERLAEALATARRRLPQAFFGALREPLAPSSP
jgi:hypothetical protein